MTALVVVVPVLVLPVLLLVVLLLLVLLSALLLLVLTSPGSAIDDVELISEMMKGTTMQAKALAKAERATVRLHEARPAADMDARVCVLFSNAACCC